MSYLAATLLDVVNVEVPQPRRHLPRSVEENRRSNLWAHYRITPEEYEVLRVQQDHRCASCGRHEDEVERPKGGRPRRNGAKAEAVALHVDHCHVTGANRKLLCNRCNSILGHANDDIGILLACARYLQQVQLMPPGE